MGWCNICVYDTEEIMEMKKVKGRDIVDMCVSGSTLSFHIHIHFKHFLSLSKIDSESVGPRQCLDAKIQSICIY